MKAPEKMQIALRLTEPLAQAIKERADQMGVNRHSYIVMVLTEHVKNSPKAGTNGERR